LKPHGKGKIVWKSGNSYEGQFELGELHGFGTYTVPESCKFKGKFLKNKANGPGVLTWSDGRKYDG
jgi:hypothetical protein